jgi:hypothetical protein
VSNAPFVWSNDVTTVREEAPRPKALLSATIKTCISNFDVIRAYVYGDASTQQKIEDYGRSNADFLRSLIRG